MEANWRPLYSNDFFLHPGKSVEHASECAVYIFAWAPFLILAHQLEWLQNSGPTAECIEIFIIDEGRAEINTSFYYKNVLKLVTSYYTFK